MLRETTNRFSMTDSFFAVKLLLKITHLLLVLNAGDAESNKVLECVLMQINDLSLILDNLFSSLNRFLDLKQH